jgi:AbrB family looped-hinge helix DNA binding protein
MKPLGSSKVTGKSIITVPKSVRELLKLRNGDLVVFVMSNGKIVVKRGRVKIED